MEDGNYTGITINQIENELGKEENKEWVGRTEIVQDKEIEKVKLTTKDGYIFYITEDKTEYKGKGEIVDTSALEKDGVLEMEITESTDNGKLVKITDKSGKDYYKIKYQIGSKDGEWQEIESGKTVEVGHGKTIYAKLVYGSNSGIVQEVSIGHTDPVIIATTEDTSNIKRKTRKTNSRIV